MLDGSVTNRDVYERLERIVRQTFKAPTIELTATTTASDVAGWDSLSHIDLIVAIEKEFNTQFTLTELESFVTIGDLVRLLAARPTT